MICALILPFLTGADAGKECLDAWNQRLKTAKTLSGSYEIEGTGAEEKVEFVLARPNMARITGGGIDYYCDGKEAVTYVAAMNKYAKRKAGRKLPLLGMTAFGMEAVAGSDSNFEYKSFAEKDGKMIVTMSHKPGMITIIGERAGISGPFEMTLTFDKASQTLQGFHLNAPDGPITGEYKNFKFDAPVAAGAFKYTLPSDAEPFEDPGLNDGLLEVGSKAPDVTLQTTDGKTVTLSEFVKKQKATLVNFWYYGCGGCMIEFPNIDRLNKQYAGKGFAVIGINPTDDTKTAADFMKEGKFSFPSLVSKDSGITPELGYQVEAFPTNYVLGPDMTILDRFIGEDEDRLLDAMEKAGIKIEDMR